MYEVLKRRLLKLPSVGSFLGGSRFRKSIQSVFAILIALSLFFSVAPQQAHAATTTYSFDSDTVGSAPSDWTSVLGTWQTQNDRAYSGSNSLKITASQDRGKALHNLILTDSTISTKVYVNSSSDKPGLILRSDSSGTNYYRFFFNGGTVYIQRGDVATVASSVYALPATSTWYNIKFEASGTTLRGKIWLVSESEPLSWNAQGIDSNLTSGYSGVFSHLTSTWFDDVAITSPSSTTTATGISYTSTLDNLALKMDVSYNNELSNAPIILVLHGYSAPFSGTDIIQRFAQKGLFAIKTYKRSMGGSQGTSDDSAREIYDFIDAIEYVKTNYSGYVDTTNINVVGYSGGGGNVYGLMTKFPDYFRSANAFFGMSDYGYDDTYGWYNNGGTSYQSSMQTRIGGTPSAARDNYYARAHYLGAKNNPYSHIQLFYDTAETTVPVTHATQYTNVANAEGFTNVVTRISDANTTVSDLSDNFATNLSDWSFVGNGSTMYTWNNSGYVDWTTNRDTTFDVMYKKFDSLRNYGKTDHIKATFKTSINSTGSDAAVMHGFRNTTDTALKNSVAIIVVNQTPYIRIDYNGTPFADANREQTAFTSILSLSTNYYFDLEINNSVVTATLKDSNQNVLETKTQNFNDALGFDGVNSFGLYDFHSAGTSSMVGTLDDVSLTSYSRWIHGYPQEGAGTAEGNIVAENYFVSDILAGTWSQPSLLTSDSMFVPGYVKTNQFYLMLGNGNDEAGNLNYNILGAGTSSSTAKTFTVEGLTGAASLTLNVYNLAPSTQYAIVDNNLTDGGTTSTTSTTNSSGTLTYTGSVGSTHRYDVYSDSTSPIVSTVSSTPTSSNVTMTWTTNENASSKVDYGLTSSYGSTTSETDTSTRVTSHSVSLSGLAACTTYHYRVRSKDAALNETIDSDNTFTTTGCTGSASVESQSASTITTASGGSLNLLSGSTGITLTVPTAFSGSDANFQIKQLDDASVTGTTSTPTSYSLIGSYLYDLKALSGISTLVSSFNNPLTVSIAYGLADITGIDESSLRIYRWDGSSWNQLTGCSVNTATRTVTCTTTAFSVFGLFGQASSSGSSSSSSIAQSVPTPPQCGDQKPGDKVPWLYSAVAQNGNSILLSFGEAADPTDHYALEFGTKSGDYPYGAGNIGGKGTRTYLVRALQPNTTYYFRVRGGNGCATGGWSNEISAKTKGLVSFNQLDFSESTLQPVTDASETDSQTTDDTCKTYTVKTKDNLWGIAVSELGDGNRYSEIVEQNKDQFPSLEKNNSVSVGWKLKINCATKTSDEKREGNDTNQQGGYAVNIKVTNKDKQPVEGAKVTIHSKVQEATTDKNGIARFENVEPGDHRVLIAYQNFEGEQSLNLTGDVKEFNLNIVVEQKNVLTSPLVIGIVGGLLAVILVLATVIFRLRSKRA